MALNPFHRSQPGDLDPTSGPNPADRERLAELCGLVDKGLRHFYAAGLALKEIQECNLYKITHSTFEAFCDARWRMSQAHATRLIQAAELCHRLGDVAQVIENENQARQLRRLPPETCQAIVDTAAATNTPLPQVLKTLLPIGKKKIRPIKFKLPGCTITIEPNKRFPGIEETARLFAEKVRADKVA